MLKLLFLDNRYLTENRGFQRQLEKPVKYSGNPLFIAEEPWENGNLSLYGSVIKSPKGIYQLWYTVVQENYRMLLAYAESDDGFIWRKPLFDKVLYNGQKTNILLDEVIHGPAIIYDPDEKREDWKYKMMAGKVRRGPIYAFHSADGVNWEDASRYPVIGTRPDSPMGFLRARDGRYVVYHRYEITGRREYRNDIATNGRRVFRSESWDMLHWSEPKLIFEPDVVDPPLTQFYGFGSTPYGPFELGTLWMYHLDSSDPTTSSGVQQTELAFARSGYAWHRAAQGELFIPRGASDTWEQGNIQCASAPVFLEDEIRYYYAGSTISHTKEWDLKPHRSGIGVASLKPDRFIALKADNKEAELTTNPFMLSSAEIKVNANILPGGGLSLAILDEHYQPLEGFEFADCEELHGDSLHHTLKWMSNKPLPHRLVRLRIKARQARLYAIFMEDNVPSQRYDDFHDNVGGAY